MACGVRSGPPTATTLLYMVRVVRSLPPTAMSSPSYVVRVVRPGSPTATVPLNMACVARSQPPTAMTLQTCVVCVVGPRSPTATTWPIPRQMMMRVARLRSPTAVLSPIPPNTSSSTAPFAQARADVLQGTSTHDLFHTPKGTRKLATFLLHSNCLLRPLPERPDPP